jgi:hypothetical protein
MNLGNSQAADRASNPQPTSGITFPVAHERESFLGAGEKYDTFERGLVCQLFRWSCGQTHCHQRAEDPEHPFHEV